MSSSHWPAGIPVVDDYLRLIRTDLFRRLEAFSDSFLARNRSQLVDYSEKWVADPLHQWSRQWEYPFTAQRLAACATALRGTGLTILDAGSGVTFFPYFLTAFLPGVEVYCVDSDEGVGQTLTLINRTETGHVQPSVASLERLDYPDAFFDCTYCISVLEHTPNHPKVIRELCRVTKPGGRLIVTFDVSLDGRGELSLAAAVRLREELEKSLSSDDDPGQDLCTTVRRPDILTTGFGAELNPALLPWKRRPSLFPRVRSLLGGRGIGTFPPPYTVCCLSLTKLSQ